MTGQVEQLRSAYALIADFKSGRLTPGTAMTREHETLVVLLADDLAVQGDRSDLGTLVIAVAQADSHWHRRAADTLIAFHDLLEAGAIDRAQSVRAQFLAGCASVWYRWVVEGAC